jgi:hypothetical protein
MDQFAGVGVVLSKKNVGVGVHLVVAERGIELASFGRALY